MANKDGRRIPCSLTSPLPVEGAVPGVRVALEGGRDVVLVAPPGSGKTTAVPLRLLGEPWLRGKKIVMLEPRRLAARSAAWRMADVLGERVGETVGYHIRLERKESAATRIVVVTEGILARRMMGDPELSGVGLVIFDEFHERNLQADVALALTRDVQQGLRPDLRTMVMSATLDDAAIAALQRGVPPLEVIRADGRLFPVETRWKEREAVPSTVPRGIDVEVGKACLRALREQAGSVLAFLPGEAEIRRTEEYLKNILSHGGTEARREDAKINLQGTSVPPCLCAKNTTDIFPLYGAMAKEDQDAALRPSPPGRRKVVLATSIAESSLTIDGIGAVVDSGWMRVSRFSPATGMERLETVRVTQDRAAQRQGRAGRLAPGICYRLWDTIMERQLSPAAAPEIETADLAAVVLTLADWGVTSPTALPWVTPPPQAQWVQAVALLTEMEAIDAHGAITPRGRFLARLPVHPRLANMLLESRRRHQEQEGSLLAAVVSERVTDDERRADIEDRMDAVRHRHSHVREVAKDFERQLSEHHLPTSSSAPLSIGGLLAMAYPGRGAQKKRSGDDKYQMACGRGGTLPQEDPLAKEEWLVVAEVDDASRDARIRLAASISEEEVLTLFGGHIAKRRLLGWDKERRCVLAAEAECL
ncbi:MAG: DEAD/DEAH box helicase, partial [Kiritimatiellaeota bacterium]|nr:DEAD/DEAH box helicase [Kiritimatiellota bacterium]